VLEHNQEAVIVLQGDHGIHMQPSHNHMANIGFHEEEILELFDSVISAVRIPPQYGGLDEPLDPLNITRLLVNRFVGENYEMLER
jgi:hypothetical protein